MNTFNAVMLDAYRELNSKKLFWITMILSGLVVGLFLIIDLTENGMTLLGFEIPLPITTDTISRETFFKGMFVQFGLGFWLAWIATILALTTTAEIFPNLLSSGSIDMVLSKPIRRSTLFLLKFLSGLLFTALQVAVFSIACFLVIGFKTGAWEPGLLLAVPVMVVFFSYLFAICVLLGVLTRSTIASLMLTLLIWFMIFLVNFADGMVLNFQVMNEKIAEGRARQVEREQLIRSNFESRLEERPDLAERIAESDARLESFREQQADAEDDAASLEKWHTGIMVVKTVLPKTGETIGLLERWLIDLADLPPPDEDEEVVEEFGVDPSEVQAELQRRIRDRSVRWVLGTSLLFELVILLFAGWRFHRRDF